MSKVLNIWVYFLFCASKLMKRTVWFFFVITVKLECSMIMADIIDFPSVRHSDNISDVIPRNTPIYLELSTYETNNYCGNHKSLIKVYIIIAIYFKMENIKPVLSFRLIQAAVIITIHVINKSRKCIFIEF
jgi:hypothetical protein